MKKKLHKILGCIGNILICIVIICCIPMTVPRVFGYEIYNIISGSMEPALPVGSAIYVQKCEPEEIEPGEVMAFDIEKQVVAHRAVEKKEEIQEFITKGDANKMCDLNPVPYHAVIGKVVFYMPYVGILFAFFSTVSGKIYMLCFVLAGVLLKLITPKEQKKDHKRTVYRWILICGSIVAVIWLVVLFLIGKSMYRYKKEANTDVQAATVYVKQENEQETDSSTTDVLKCPVSVDFESLKKVNPEIVAWIYCEDTVIHYAVCRAEDNAYYLTHSYDKKSKVSGSIFMETANAPDCSDANIILYGHHMKNKTMFATLSDWSSQTYYEEHPVMWLLTPEKTYRVKLFSGYVTDALSDTYTVFEKNSPFLTTYIEQAIQKSDFTANVPELKTMIESGTLKNEQFVVLSTCAYESENARYVLHGYLEPVIQ